jgi:hypothetical protein
MRIGNIDTLGVMVDGNRSGHYGTREGCSLHDAAANRDPDDGALVGTGVATGG